MFMPEGGAVPGLAVVVLVALAVAAIDVFAGWWLAGPPVRERVKGEDGGRAAEMDRREREWEEME